VEGWRWGVVSPNRLNVKGIVGMTESSNAHGFGKRREQRDRDKKKATGSDRDIAVRGKKAHEYKEQKEKRFETRKSSIHY